MKKLHLTHSHKEQNGVALITALLIVSLATIMAVSLISRQYMDVRRTGNIMNSDKAYLQALTMEVSAAQLLTFSRKELKRKYDDIEEFDQAVLGLNANAMKVAENEASVQLALIYPEARFNINALIGRDGKVNKAQQDRFRLLLSEVLRDIGESESRADELIASLLDWMDDDEDVRPSGAEDSLYESKDPPYKTANRSMVSISELQLVEGFEPVLLYGIPKDEKDENSEAIPGLLSYVTVLPDKNSTINVNLVTDPKMIKLLSVYITDTMATDILAAQPFEDLSQFINHEVWDEIKSSDNGGGENWKKLKKSLKEAQFALNVQSSYFVARSTASLGKSVFILNSLVYVAKDGTKLEVISRTVGRDAI